MINIVVANARRRIVLGAAGAWQSRRSRCPAALLQRRTAASDAAKSKGASKWVTANPSAAAGGGAAAAAARPKKGLIFDASAMDAVFSGPGKFIMGAGIITLGGGAYLILSQLERSAPFMQSRALIVRHEALVDALGGEPVTSTHLSARGHVKAASGEARLSYDVRGPTGAAKVTVEATCRARDAPGTTGGGAWTLTRVEAVVEDTGARFLLVGEPRVQKKKPKKIEGADAGADAADVAAADGSSSSSSTDDARGDGEIYPTDTREYSWQEVAILSVCGAGIGLLGGRLLARRWGHRTGTAAGRGTVYERAVRRAQGHAPVAAALGTPLRRVGKDFRGQDMGSFVTGEIDVAGPNGTARVALQAVKQAASAPGVPKAGKWLKPKAQAVEDARWTLTHLEVMPENAKKPIPVPVIDTTPKGGGGKKKKK